MGQIDGFWFGNHHDLFWNLGCWRCCFQIYVCCICFTNELQNTHVLPCVDIFPCFFFSCFSLHTVFYQRKNDHNKRHWWHLPRSVTRLFESRRFEATTSNCCGINGILWDVVIGCWGVGYEWILHRIDEKIRWPNWGSLKNCGNYKGRMKEERFYCLCKIVWYLHYVH